MNMIFNKTSNQILRFCFSALTVCLLLSTHSVCVGQQDETKPLIGTYQLRYIPVDQAYQIASTMFQDQDDLRLSMIEAQNVIVVYGVPETQKKLETLFEKIDIGKTQEKTIVRVYRLSHQKSDHVARMLANLLTSEQSNSIKIAPDPQSNSLIVSCKEADVKVIEDLIKRVDAISDDQETKSQPENIVVRITWLVDADELNQVPVRDALRTPGASLSELVVGLRQAGALNNAKTLTETQTTVQINPSSSRAREFNSASSRMVDGQLVEMSCIGRVDQSVGGQYEINVNLSLASGVKQKVGSTLILPKKHPVAFSISDVGDFKSAAVVEILDSK